MSRSLLVNFWYAHPVGHAIEGLRLALGFHRADPRSGSGVLLSRATATELGDRCPFVVGGRGHPAGALRTCRATGRVPRGGLLLRSASVRAVSPGSRASTSTSGSRRPFRARSTASTCDVIVAPHTGFGRAALAVGTPWLALSGGPWHEYLCNGVPFMSVHPDTARYPAYAQFGAGALVDDEGEPRTPSMTRARIEEDQPRIVEGARELVNGRLSYEEACGRHFRSLPVAYSGDRSCLFSFDSIHERHILTGASGLSGSEPQALGTEAVSVRSSRSWPPRRDFVAQSH